MLLLHVSGLPAESFVWRDQNIPPDERIARVLASPLESRPDRLYRYSCVGYIAAGAVIERATGATLPELLDELVTAPRSSCMRVKALRAGAMVSRIAHLVLVDCLFMGVARLRFEETIDALKRTRDITHPERGD
jgi:hypothetical protein